MSVKLALVTGASRGIGRSILMNLARQGFYVVGTATSDLGVQSIKKTLEEIGLEGEGRVLRMQDPKEIETFMKNLIEEKGLPFALVNNAGITRDNLFMRMSDEEWESVIQTNLSGVFYLTRACIRGMLKAKEGRIINVGSVVGSLGNPGQTNYCAAKAGLIGFSKALAREVASRGITVNVVSPGFIQTDMTEKLNEAQKAAILSTVPMGRMGSPEDIAGAVGFLVSSAGAYITGETLHVNGGMWMS